MTDPAPAPIALIPSRGGIPLEAPDFTEGYPSQGAKLGPAWQRAWNVLALARLTGANDGWLLRETLVRDMTPRKVPGLPSGELVIDVPGVHEKTARQLLANARKVGILEKRGEQARPQVGRECTIEYRIAKDPS